MFEVEIFAEDVSTLEVLMVFEMSIQDGDMDFITALPSLKRLLIDQRKHYNINVEKYAADLLEKFGDYDISLQQT